MVALPHRPTPDGVAELVGQVTDDDTWRSLMERTAAALRAAGIEGAESDARWIVSEASGRSAAEIAADRAGPTHERQRLGWATMTLRRAAGEPLQYVLGRWGFRHLDLMVDRRVLIPRPETEQLVEVALELVDPPGRGPTRWLDVGTGTGAIALSIAREVVDASVWATDVSTDALAVARANLAALGRAAARVRLVEGSWFEGLAEDLAGTFDAIVSNPPYVPDDEILEPVVADWEPVGALRGGSDGTDGPRAVLDGARRWLAPGGWVVVEHAPDQAEALRDHAHSLGLIRVATRLDLAGRPRMVVARHPDGA